jgi:hypothetical protein
METAFKVISDLSNVWNIDILIVLVIIFGKLEVDFLSEKELKEEIHQLAVLLLLEVVIGEHHNTSANDQFSSTFLVLINRTNRSVARVSKRARSEDSIGRVSNGQRCSIDIDKIYSCPFGLFLIFLFIFFSASHHECVIVSPFWLLRVTIDNSGDLLI